MPRFKTLFQGDKTIVIQLKDGITVQDLVTKGVFIQKADGLYDKKGRKVIISESDFFHTNGESPKLTGNCGGSVYEIMDNTVISAGHVMKCVDTLQYGNATYRLSNIQITYPITLPQWIWNILLFFNIEIPSPYDYGYATFQSPTPISFQTDEPYPRAIYVAGNCLYANQQNCLGIALATPNMPEDDLKALVNVKLTLNCTYWGYVTHAIGLDVGKSFVNYGDDKYALLEPALLMQFTDKAGIPGCSGSMVYPTPLNKP